MNVLKALVATLVVSTSQAHAEGPDRVGIVLGSYHINSQFDFNEQNLGAVLVWDNGGYDVSVGGYINSFGGNSLVATLSAPILETQYADLKAVGGVAYYDGTGHVEGLGSYKGFLPLVGLQIEADGHFVQVMAGDGVTADALVTFGLAFDTY